MSLGDCLVPPEACGSSHIRGSRNGWETYLIAVILFVAGVVFR